MVTKTKEDLALIGHLLRRAGFGGPFDEMEAYAAKGYDAAAEELLRPEEGPQLDEDVLFRFAPQWVERPGQRHNQAIWVYRMITRVRPLEEKIALFWHSVLCTGYAKVDSGRQMGATIELFRHQGLGNFRELLVELARDPGMIYYLDNCISHKGAINENWGRELLELFSMGVGNYNEDDVKEAARAFTGWTNAPALPTWPYGRRDWQFHYDPTDHDKDRKAFLGHEGRFNGEDVIEIVCQQPATARFIARHMYNFFVADELPVPQWSQTQPRDPRAIQSLVDAYFDSQYDVRSMLRVLFKSDFFKNSRFNKIKSPTEVVVGTMRLLKDSQANSMPRPGFADVVLQCNYMGQDLLNPPTVEGWHTGMEWIDSGTLVERVNFCSDQLGDIDKQGVREVIARLRSRDTQFTPGAFVDACLEQLGAISVGNETRGLLAEHASSAGPIFTAEEGFGARVGDMLKLIAATKEYQFG